MKKASLVRTLAAVCLAFSISAVMAQTSGTPANSRVTKSAEVEKPFNPLLALPDALVQSLALTPKQQKLLDDAHIARRQMWSALRNARQAEYAAMTKELEKEKFDPREVIAIRKKIRQAADKRLDEVQSGWLAFWDTLTPEQSKRLVTYMKEQHILQGKMSATRPSTTDPVVRPAESAVNVSPSK